VTTPIASRASNARSNEETYPKRPKFFALKFIRLMGKACVANELGADVYCLLATIATTEDARGYRSPVTYFNEQLMPIVGLGSVDSLDRVRARAIENGWLHYEKGARRTPGKYWVIVPDHIEGWDDGPTDEQQGEYSSAFVRKKVRKKVRKNPRSICGNNRGQSAEPSSLPLSLTPKEKEKAEEPPIPPVDSFADAEKPKTALAVRRHDPLFDAIAEVTGSDPSVAGGHVAKVRHLLAKAEPPYTPDDVREFGRRFYELCPWAADGKGRLPTLGEIEKNIGKLRAPAPVAPPVRNGFANRDDWRVANAARQIQSVLE
jgi:hypothetical protein